MPQVLGPEEPCSHLPPSQQPHPSSPQCAESGVNVLAVKMRSRPIGTWLSSFSLRVMHLVTRG
jgi:hypothetical protein